MLDQKSIASTTAPALATENLRASTLKVIEETRKVRLDADIVEETKKTKPWIRNFPATQLTVILGLITFLFQSFSVIYNSYLNHYSHEDSEWRQTVRTVSITNADKALTGALNLETFYSSSRYGYDAKQLVIASLPALDDPNTFNTVYYTLFHAVKQHEVSLIYAVDTAIAGRYRAIYEEQVYPNQAALEKQPAFPTLFETKLADDARFPEGSPVRRAIDLRESELDSITSSLADRWREQPHWKLRATTSKDTKVAKCGDGTYSNMRGLVLRLDDDAFDVAKAGSASDQTRGFIRMDNLDFSCVQLNGSYLKKADLRSSSLDRSDLSGADMSHAKLSGAFIRCANVQGTDFNSVTDFSNSDWSGTDWTSASLSPNLKAYLEQNRRSFEKGPSYCE